MKRKYVIIPLILGCYLLAGCRASSNESSNTVSGTEMVTDQDDPIADISKIEQIFIDEYTRQNDNLQCVGNIIEKLGDSGFIAIDSDNKVDMVNAENMHPFVDSLKTGEHAGVFVLQVIYSRGLNAFEITTDEGNVNVEQTYYAWPDYNSDYAFTNVIVVKPFEDGTFRILSNDVTEQELRLPQVAYSE